MPLLIKRFFILIGLTSLLLACSTQPPTVSYLDPQDPQWQNNLQQLQQIRSYAIEGQLGYIGRQERFSSRFDWRYQNPQSYQLRLFSTISPASLLIRMTAQGMSITDNKGNQQSEQDAQRLLQQIIGMNLPLAQLSNWLKGQPEENQDYQVGQNHLLAHFAYYQQGERWTVDYLSYHQQYTPPLPREILIKNQDTTLKIQADNWTY